MEQIYSILNAGFIQTYGKDVLFIILLFLFGKYLLRQIVRRAIGVTDRKSKSLHQRANTLGKVLVSTGNVVIYVIILLMVLEMFGIDIRPILAGAGILGLAIGFGAQSLVKEFVAGLFILLEDQYGVGDKVKIGAVEGEVVRISMRSTVLKDKDGNMIYISNGAVANVVNYSQK